LQGHSAAHLKFCLETYLASGIPHLGFGSFDTSGVDAEINLFTAKAWLRLETLRELLAGPYLRGEPEPQRQKVFAVPDTLCFPCERVPFPRWGCELVFPPDPCSGAQT